MNNIITVCLIIILLIISVIFLVLYIQEKQQNKTISNNKTDDKKIDQIPQVQTYSEKSSITIDQPKETIVERIVLQDKIIRSNIYIQPPYLILVYIPGYSDDVGGIQVLYQLADHIHKVVDPEICTVKIVSFMHVKFDTLFSEYLTEHDVVDWDRTIVIYPECIAGNPLNAKNIIRWLLFRPSEETYNTWNKTDVLYYYSSFSVNAELPQHKYLMYCIRLRDYPEQVCEKIYKSLGMRRKCGNWFTSEEVNDFLSVCDRSVDGYHYNDILSMIRASDEFRCCDAYSYWSFIAAFVGVTSIVKPIHNTTKEAWCRSLVCSDYIFNRFKPEDFANELPEFSTEEIMQRQPFGVAWGDNLREIEWANKTKHLCYKQQQYVAKYGEETIQTATNEWFTLFFGEKTRDFYDSNGGV